MKKPQKNLSVFCASVILIFFSLLSSLYASDDSERNSRQGVFFSMIGFGGMNLIPKKGSVLGGVRVGYGIIEDLLVFLEAGARVTYLSNQQLFFPDIITLVDTQVKAQYYAWKGLYLNAGAGPVITRFSSGTKVGIGTSAGIGYEFRIGKLFFIAPEGRIEYIRISGNNILPIEAGVQLGFHF